MTAKDPHLVKTPIDKTQRIDSTVDNHDDAVQNMQREKSLQTEDSTVPNAHTEINKGTESLDTANTKHVDEADDPARQPDRRDQQGGTAFDGGVNNETLGHGEQVSDEINDYNRYANIDNAQKRVLNTDERDD